MRTNQNENLDNDLNGTEPLCAGEKWTRLSSCAARMKLNKEVNKVVIKDYFSRQPFDENRKPIRGYQQ